jgi:hypothetical protein
MPQRRRDRGQHREHRDRRARGDRRAVRLARPDQKPGFLILSGTPSRILTAPRAKPFLIAFLSVKVSNYDLVTAGLACVAAGLFFEGTM